MLNKARVPRQSNLKRVTGGTLIDFTNSPSGSRPDFRYSSSKYSNVFQQDSGNLANPLAFTMSRSESRRRPQTTIQNSGMDKLRFQPSLCEYLIQKPGLLCVSSTT